MSSRERELGRVEEALAVRLPRGLYAGEAGARNGAVDPEALLKPGSGLIQGGRMPPDTLPIAVGGNGDAALLRFDGWGAPVEVVAWHGDGSYHPAEATSELPSPAARALCEARAALRTGLLAMSETLGRNALAHDLGVSGETFAGWLLDARLVPEPHRVALRRLSGQDEAALFRQDWQAAAAVARRIGALRPDLAWPGVVLGYAAEGRGERDAAAAAYAAALLAEAPTLALREAGRSHEEAARLAADAWRRCAGGGPDPGPALSAALAGARAVRAHHLAECDRLRRQGRAAQAYDEARRAGWRRHVPVDMDDVLGRMGDTAGAAGAMAHAALARLHLRAWMAAR
jgi:hypothetical protein